MDAACYSRQFAQRQPRKVQKKPKPKLKPQDVRGASSRSEKTLVDALKQHGVRLCDGMRLNAVGKRIQLLGKVPPSVSASVTALYLSQNNLRSLEGVEQFAAVRLLSVGGNLLVSDKELARLERLSQLRNLNLVGNPLCDQPNYRLRAVALLKQLQVLDNCDVTRKEREAARQVAAQDEALRNMVTQNHFDIQKLQRIAQLIVLHKELYGRVMAGVVVGKFDRVPSPTDVACNVPLLLRVWRYEDALSVQERETLQVQMLAIIIRTHAKLADHPKVKAKEYLLKLANGSSPKAQRMNGTSNWEEAYANVIALQQKTIANLQALCERNRREMVEFLKNLLSMDPRQRNKIVGGPRAQVRTEVEMKQPARPCPTVDRPWTGSQMSERERSVQHQLPPQQQDPDMRDPEVEVAAHGLLSSPILIEQPTRPLSPCEQRKNRAPRFDRPRAQELPNQVSKDRKAALRSGDFDNKSLGEAIHSFKLRDLAAAPSSNKPLGTMMPPPTKIPQLQCAYPMHRQDNLPLPPELVVKQLPLFPDTLLGNALRVSYPPLWTKRME